MVEYTLNFDGSCWPNPGGTAAYGFVLKLEGHIMESGHGVIGTSERMSNNVSEFYALAQGVYAFQRQTQGRSSTERVVYALQVKGDSNLVVQVMNGVWNAKRDKLYYDAYEEAKLIVDEMKRLGHYITFEWIPRELNQECDDLSKAHQVKEAA